MKLLTILFIFIPMLIVGQKSHIDSTFYQNGSLKTVRYKEGFRYGGASIMYFKNSLNVMDWNQPIVDSSFQKRRILVRIDSLLGNIYKDTIDWSIHERNNRIFLNDLANVSISKLPYLANSDKKNKDLRGIYHFLFPEMNFLDLEIQYNADTTIEGLSIFTYDTSNCCDNFKELFFRTAYISAKFSSNGIAKENEFKCDKYGFLTLVFDPRNLLKEIYFYDTTQTERYYELDEIFFCKRNGYYKNRKLKIGEWREYHSNGNISSIGVYLLKDKEGGTVSVKDGVWNYYNQNGSLLKREVYRDGMLITNWK